MNSVGDRPPEGGLYMRLVGVVILATLSVIACGKKGPPLAPFVRVPAAVGSVASQRIGNDIYLSFAVPSANKDGQAPADIGSLEVYAITSTRPPATEEQRDVATLIATIPVRPIMPELPPSANGSPPPVIPLPPGVDRSATVVVKEPITADLLTPVEFAAPEDTETGTAEDAEPEVFGPLVAPPPTLLPRRHYFVVGISPRGRKSDPSTPLSVPLETGSSAPGAPKVEYTETQMMLTWAPPTDVRTATFLMSASAPGATGELRRDLAGAASSREGGPPVAPTNASAKNVTPPAPAPVLLPAKSLGFTSQPTTYNLYATTTTDPAPVDPFDIKLPAPLTPQPLPTTQHVLTGVAFGVERCFEVRAVDQVGGATVMSPPSPRTCITPLDTFPPTAPRSLAVIAGSGTINLIWDANTEADLVGYLVLRAEAPGDTLQPVTKEPVAAATYRDETVKPGTRYVYAVVAVDRAGNRSPESNRMEETARQ